MGGKPKIRRNTNQRISSSSTMLKAEEKREIEKVHAELLFAPLNFFLTKIMFKHE